MQRSFTVLSLAIVSGLVLAGCPDKSATKEEPATPDTPAAAEPPAEEKKADEKPAEKPAEPAAKEEGGW